VLSHPSKLKRAPNGTTALEAAHQAGYQAPYPGYQGLSARYVAELRKPWITLGRSISLTAALRAGFVLGVVVHEWPQP